MKSLCELNNEAHHKGQVDLKTEQELTTIPTYYPPNKIFKSATRIKFGYWFVRWEQLSGNDDKESSGVTVTTFGTVVTRLHGGTKGVYKHISTPTLKSVIELRKIV